MGRFAGLANVKTAKPRLFFKDGNYKVRIEKMKYLDAGETRSGVDTFVVETQIVESDNPDLKAGMMPCQVLKMKKDILEVCLSDMKQCIAAVLGVTDPDNYNEEVGADDQIEAKKLGVDAQTCANDRFWSDATAALVSDQQPAKGMLIQLHCYTRMTKNNKPITKHIWGPVVGEEKSA